MNFYECCDLTKKVYLQSQLRIVTSRSSKEYNLGLNATALRLRQSLKGIIIPDLEILHISSIYLNKEKKSIQFFVLIL